MMAVEDAADVSQLGSSADLPQVRQQILTGSPE